jgi:hypothetical protein
MVINRRRRNMMLKARCMGQRFDGKAEFVLSTRSEIAFHLLYQRGRLLRPAAAGLRRAKRDRVPPLRTNGRSEVGDFRVMEHPTDSEQKVTKRTKYVPEI